MISICVTPGLNSSRNVIKCPFAHPWLICTYLYLAARRSQSWMWYQGTLCWAGVNKIFENNDLIFDCLLLWGYPDSFFCLPREEQCTSSIGQWRRVPVHISMERYYERLRESIWDQDSALNVLKCTWTIYILWIDLLHLSCNLALPGSVISTCGTVELRSCTSCVSLSLGCLKSVK